MVVVLEKGDVYQRMPIRKRCLAIWGHVLPYLLVRDLFFVIKEGVAKNRNSVPLPTKVAFDHPKYGFFMWFIPK